MLFNALCMMITEMPTTWNYFVYVQFCNVYTCDDMHIRHNFIWPLAIRVVHGSQIIDLLHAMY